MDRLPGLQTLPLWAVPSLRATAAAGGTNGGHWRGSSSRAALSQSQLDTAPPPVLPVQPGAGIAAARDIFSLVVGYSCLESDGGGRGRWRECGPQHLSPITPRQTDADTDRCAITLDHHTPTQMPPPDYKPHNDTATSTGSLGKANTGRGWDSFGQ